MTTELEQREAKEKAEAEKRQKERDGIKVTKTEVKKDDDEKEEKEEKEEDKSPDDGEGLEEEDSEEDSKETKEDGDEGSEEEAEVDEAGKQTKSIEKLERTIARLQKRLDKTSGSNKALAKELSDAQKKLEAKQAEGEEVLTEEEVEARSEKKAQQKLLERQFAADSNRLAGEAEKILKLKPKEFDAKIKEVVDDIGQFPSQMIGILADLDNGGAVLAYLLNDVDEMEEIYNLPLVKMSNRLNKLSEKVKPKEKQLSKVPPPNEPIGGSGGSPKFDPYNVKKMSTKEWVEKREKDIAERRAAKLAAYR